MKNGDAETNLDVSRSFAHTLKSKSAIIAAMKMNQMSLKVEPLAHQRRKKAVA